jgi:hypothetical protein
MQPGATSLNSNMIRDGHPACRLKPASPAVPAASAKEENKNNNDEKCLGIHDVQPFQCDGSGLGFSTISAFARMHIIWGDAIVPASLRSASSGAGRCFCLPRRISIRSAVMVARSTMSRTRLAAHAHFVRVAVECGCPPWTLIEPCALRRSLILGESWKTFWRCSWPHRRAFRRSSKR